MKIVAISDTHGNHLSLKLPKADMIIHAGDFSPTFVGNRKKNKFEDHMLFYLLCQREDLEVKNFLKWFGELKYRYKILTAGNHDFLFEDLVEDELRKIIPENVVYLNDSGITVEGIKIWGSPITPYFFNWAFNRRRGKAIKVHWDLIPQGTDIVITHGPVRGVLDKNCEDNKTGCYDLLKRIQIIKPRYYVCGHIHENPGIVEKDGVTYINACKPITFEI